MEGVDVWDINTKKQKWGQSCKSKEVKNATDHPLLGFFACTRQRSCKATSGATSQNQTPKVVMQVENYIKKKHKMSKNVWSFSAASPRTANRSNVSPPLFFFTSIPRSFHSSLFFKGAFSVHVPLSAGDTPHPCTASSSCPVRASDRGFYTTVEDVTGTTTPLSTKPCANPAKRQIRHQKLSLWEHTALLANEPTNRWQHVSTVP